MTCPRKYCLIDTCRSNADAEHHARRLYIEPDDNVDTEQFPTYEPPEPVSVADQVECIAGNTAMYAISELRCGLVSSSSNLLPSTYDRAKGVCEGHVLSMGAQVLCGFRVAFQKFTLRQSELLDEVVNVVFRSHLDHLHFESSVRAASSMVKSLPARPPEMDSPGLATRPL